jgi:aminopeptidase N
MKKVYLLMIIFLSVVSLNAREYAIYSTKTAKKLTIKELAEKTYKNDVIFFGEFHDDSVLHDIQRLYLAELYKLNSKIVLSMEMFERDAQPVIDSFFNNQINEEVFLKSSRPWPEYKKYYKPLVDLAKTNNSSLIGANIPRKYAGIYASEGWTGIEKLKANDRSLVARSIKVEDDIYLKKFYNTMLKNMGMDTNSVLTPNQENTLYLYYGAQVIKDETMAESIVDYILKNKKSKVIHFNGDFHSNNYQGTVRKLIDRDKDLSLAVIAPTYVDSGKAPDFDAEAKAFGDYLIVIEEKDHEQVTQEMMGGHLGENYITGHKIKISINPEKHSLEGTDLIKFKNPIARKSSFRILKSIKINELKSTQGELEFKTIDDSLYSEIVILPKSKEINELSVSYAGEVYNSPNITLLNQKHSNTPGIISSADGEGIYLPGGSYFGQADKDIADFEVEVTLPKELTIITSGTLVSAKENDGKKTYIYKSEIPTDDMILVGGKYIQKDTVYEGKTFSLFTFAPSTAGDSYLKSSIDFYKYYTKLFGPYPYSSFRIVENFFASGFGMPGYTLLSNKLMAMPWIVLAPGSLAHEFVHNWWGNSVYVDQNSGNWCEALTTFSSNYYYNVITNKPAAALDWRKKALISLESLPEKNNYPVGKFKYQKNSDDAVIGYQKGGFVFYELMKIFGEEKFFTVIKNFAQKMKGKRASWTNLRILFNEQTKKDSTNIPTKKIFDQWLNELKIPTLSLDNVKIESDSIAFEIKQDLKFYLSVPVKIITKKDTISKFFTITKESNNFKIEKIKDIQKIVLDPDYQSLRKLNKWEIPYSFAQTLGDSPLIITPSKSTKDYDVYTKFVDMVKESDYNVTSKSVDDLKDEDWADKSIIVLGNQANNKFFQNFKTTLPENIIIKNDEYSINKQSFKQEGNLLLVNHSNPKNNNKFASIISCGSLQNAEQFKRLFHYLSYSLVMVSQTQQGRPLTQMEIFPVAGDKSKIEYQFK